MYHIHQIGSLNKLKNFLTFRNILHIFKPISNHRIHFLVELFTWLFLLDFQLVVLSEFFFELLHSSQSRNLTFNHDDNFGSESFRFFHGMGGQKNTRVFTFGTHIIDNRPHESSTFRVHSRTRFIQKNNLRTSQQSDRSTQFSLVTS